MNILTLILAAATLCTAHAETTSQLSVKDNVIYCGECKLAALTDFKIRYTLPSEDIHEGRKCPEAYADHRPTFEVSANGYYEEETQSSMTVSTTKDGIEISVSTPLKTLSEYGVGMPFNFMGKSKSGGWKKQYLLNNVFRSTDGKLMYAYLTNPSGCNVAVIAQNNLAGWKQDYSDNNHFFVDFIFLANMDKEYGIAPRENEVKFKIIPVKDYDDLLDKVAKEYGVPFLDVNKTGGKIGDKIQLTSHGKTDALRVVNELNGVDKIIPFKNEIEVEYESDTYLYPIKYSKKGDKIGGEAEIYGYSDIIDTYRKTMDKVSLFQVFHRRNNEFDGNLCEHQCWMSAALRFLMKYGDRMDAEETRKLVMKLQLMLDVITETDPTMAISRVTILNVPHDKYPAYNTFGLDRIQEEAFGMTILLDAYKYFGDQKYYDYLVNTMDSFLNTYQREDGAIVRLNGSDYSTVCCMIIPIIDVANFLKDKDKERSERYMQSAGKLAWHIYRRGLDFPTEGGGTDDPDEKEMEDGSISCSALSLLYYCNNIEYVPEFVVKAKEILDVHESWVMQSSSCGTKCSSLRWWETGWEGDQNGPAICAGHAWTIWRAEADWLYYDITGDAEYYEKAFNGFMSNISKIRPDGTTFSIRNIDMIPGGGFSNDPEDWEFKIQNKFPETPDSGLSRYVWIRAHSSILDSLK